MYKISSESTEFCRRYDKNVFVFSVHNADIMKMYLKFLCQGFQKLEYEQNRHTDRLNTQTHAHTDATERITTPRSPSLSMHI